MIHPSAVVSPRAKLGENVQIGAFCLIHDDVEIGDNCEIQAYCELGVATPLAEGPLVIGSNSLIRSHSVFYRGSVFGSDLKTGHHVCVREKTRAGVSFQIGTQTEIQGDCQIGSYVRFQSKVFVPQRTDIRDFVWLFPSVVITNDRNPPSDDWLGVVIEAYAAVGAASVVLPGVKIGQHSLVAAHSTVTRNVDSHTLVRGTPARAVSHTSDVLFKDGSNEPAYPWTRHFHRGYPPEVVARWLNGEDYAKT